MSGETTDARSLRTATRNLCHLRLLERIARRFAEEAVPLMALKGAALLLTVYHRPHDRPMTDLDLMVRPDHAGRAVQLLEELGCRPGRPLVRGDFFPRYYYETEFLSGRALPLRIDLHVRPFRPLRYARTVPGTAFWDGAGTVQIGNATVLIPAPADMLIHLAVHSAIHANARITWLRDMQVWADTLGDRLDWDRFIDNVRDWRLAWPVRSALDRVSKALRPICPPGVAKAIADLPVTWRDRRVLKNAPRDADAPAAHVLTDALCTPGPRFVLGYLAATLLPDRVHMGEWYDRRHFGWLAAAHALRLASPMLKRVPLLWNRLSKVELRETWTGRPALFAARIIRAGERIAEDDRSDIRRSGVLASSRFVPGAKVRYAKHSCGPNARFDGRRLVAIKVIDAGDEISYDHGDHACTCRRQHQPAGLLAAGAA